MRPPQQNFKQPKSHHVSQSALIMQPGFNQQSSQNSQGQFQSRKSSQSRIPMPIQQNPSANSIFSGSMKKGQNQNGAQNRTRNQAPQAQHVMSRTYQQNGKRLFQGPCEKSLAQRNKKLILQPQSYSALHLGQQANRSAIMGNKKKLANAGAHGSAQLSHEYIVQCTVKEAQLDNDFSSIFGQVRLYCKLRFLSRHLILLHNGEELLNANQLVPLPWEQIDFHNLPEKKRSRSSDSQPGNTCEITEKCSQDQQGQRPKWDEIFSFGYQKLSKICMKILDRKKPAKEPDIPPNAQDLELSLFKRGMLFNDELIGKVTLKISESEKGIKTNWFTLFNEKKELVGKLLLHIDIKRDTTQRQLRLIQRDLIDQVPAQPVLGINQDSTDMPFLRNHEQVCLLDNQDQAPLQNISQLVNRQSPSDSGLASHQSQTTHITHQSGQQKKNYLETTHINQSQPQVINQEYYDEEDPYGDEYDSEDVVEKKANLEQIIGHGGNLQTHCKEYETEDDSEDDEYVSTIKRKPVKYQVVKVPGGTVVRGSYTRSTGGQVHDANPSLLGFAVVETQHIHEDEEDVSEEADMIDMEVPENFMPKSTKGTTTVNEGGGITSGQNQTSGDEDKGFLTKYQQQAQAPMPKKSLAKKKKQQQKRIDDDESNINSDEEHKARSTSLNNRQGKRFNRPNTAQNYSTGVGTKSRNRQVQQANTHEEEMIRYHTGTGSGRYIKKAPANLPRGPSNQRMQNNRNLVEQMGLVRLGPVQEGAPASQGKKKVVGGQRGMQQFRKKGVVSYTPVVAGSQGPIEHYQRVDGNEIYAVRGLSNGRNQPRVMLSGQPSMVPEDAVPQAHFVSMDFRKKNRVRPPGHVNWTQQQSQHSNFQRPIPTQPVGSYPLQTNTSQYRFHSQNTYALHTQAEQDTNLQGYYEDEEYEELDPLGEIEDEELLEEEAESDQPDIEQPMSEENDQGTSLTSCAPDISHNSLSRMSKKRRRQHVSSGKNRGEFMLIRYPSEKQQFEKQKAQQAMQHNQSLASGGGVAIGSNSLEQETFSIQQNTFQEIVNPSSQEAMVAMHRKPVGQGSVYASSGGTLRNIIRSGTNLSQIPVEKGSISSNNMYHQRIVRNMDSQNHHQEAETQPDHSMIQHMTSHSSSDQELRRQKPPYNGKKKSVNSQRLQMLNAIDQQNNRGLNHEVALNQMQQKLTEKLAKNNQLKREAIQMKQDAINKEKELSKREQDLEEKLKKFQKKKHNLKKSKLLVKNETAKIKILNQKFQELIKLQQQVGSTQLITGVEVSAQLSSIAVMIELLLNDRSHLESSAHKSNKRKSRNSSSEDSSSDISLDEKRVNQEQMQSMYDQMKELVDNFRHQIQPKDLSTQASEQQLQMMQLQVPQMMQQVPQLQNYMQLQPVMEQHVQVQVPQIDLVPEMQPQQIAEMKVEAQEPVQEPQVEIQGEESEMSEFIFDPDPNFLLQINQNIRNNNVQQNDLEEADVNRGFEPSSIEEEEKKEIFIQNQYEIQAQVHEEGKEEIISCGSDVEIQLHEEQPQLPREEEKGQDAQPGLREELFDKKLLPASGSQQSLQQEAILRQVSLELQQQHANTDRNQVQGTQGHEQHYGRPEGESSNSQIPESQMSAFQSRNQVMQKLVSVERSGGGPPSGRANQMWAGASSQMMGASATLTPSASPSPSPAVYGVQKKQAEIIQDVQNIEEDEITRRINEQQEELESQSMYNDGSSYSQTDTLHQRPKGMDRALMMIRQQQQVQAVRIVKRGSVLVNVDTGEVHDQPKKAVYGIKKANNNF